MNPSNFQQSIIFVFILLILFNIITYIANKFYQKKWKYQFLSNIFIGSILFFITTNANYYSYLSILPKFKEFDISYICIIMLILTTIEEKWLVKKYENIKNTK